MAKRDRDYENRMAGYISAYNKAKTEGIEALGKDIEIRNILEIDIKIPESVIRRDYDLIAKKTVMNIMASALWTLHDSFGFGKQRLVKYKNAFEKVVQDTCDLDYLGQRYVRLEDFAVELNERYDLGIDVECVAACQDAYDKKENNFGKYKTDTLLKELRENGYRDAAVFIENKLY